MWEAISSNQRRSLWLISIMGAVPALLGALIGLTIAMNFGSGSSFWDESARRTAAPAFWDQVAEAQSGAYFGIAAAILLWLIMWLTAVGAGDSILVSSAGARRISKEDAPQLWNVVEEMAIASGLGKMPSVHIIDDPSPNAFAAGYSENRSAVAVTSGLLKRLNRDELQGVIAHEIGHIKNRDVRFMTLAGVMVGVIVLISHSLTRSVFYSGGGRRRSSKGGGQAQVIVFVITLLIAILAPIAAQALYFACSRKREYLADASAARYTRYPPGLASALEKISRSAGGMQVNKVVAPMCIVNPLQARGGGGLFSTHPATEDRVRILRSMAGAGFAAYEEACRKAGIKGGSGMGSVTLSQAEDVQIREPATEAQRDLEERVKQAVAVGAVLEHMLPLVVLTCACGVKLKLPPDFKRPTVACPRCGKGHEVPKARAGGDARREKDDEGRAAYRRKSDGWESFQCVCGKAVQLSPSFSAPQAVCRGCLRRIDILPVVPGGSSK